ncbi:Eco57I restriction-modification methylase domain-containing protein [Streptomyces glomeratus]|uniref:Eco57I restriction-modification methylase domain-containing protein n=1 Tax=Streptomyces glomeratus TaxID=284452 RepID=UPI0031DCD103
MSKRVLHKKGSFVFRLSGRERQRSASYYTPEVLTRSTVKHALAELLDQDGKTTTAREILDLTVCEPALGSGAFLNEAIYQLATEYLRRRMAEVGEQLPPDRYEVELQKTKAYLALHNCYGVDLNQTAVELAEVSLWLNAMHEGLKAPWFGMHLRRGNSLIGARRAVFDAAALKGKAWLTTVPTDRPLRPGAEDGAFQAGQDIHHFLLPAKGWGAVADTKQAKELAKEERDKLADWRKEVTKTPSTAQTKRLLALATRVERLWELASRRLIVSEREIRRDIEVWQAPDDQLLPRSSGAVSREQIESALRAPGSPLGRLKLVMDAWCALWFWPVGQPGTPNPPTMDEWLAFCEAVLGVPLAKARSRGRHGGAAGHDDTLGLFADTGDFEQLAVDDDNDRLLSQCADLPTVAVNFPWLAEMDAISRREGFFHWELEFAHIFQHGGFDLQVGNPPWVRLDWEDNLVLAEHDPWFSLTEKAPEKVRSVRRASLLSIPSVRLGYLADLNSWAGLTEILGSPIEHPVLSGLRTNLYMNFMERAWRNLGVKGIVGLLHPETHFNAPKGGLLRSATYQHLRRFIQFANNLLLFEEIDNNIPFALCVYGRRRTVSYLQISRLSHPETADKSITHPGGGEIPGVQFDSGGWDLRPHRDRVIQVTEPVLSDWAELLDAEGTPASQARMLRPLTRGDNRALRVLSRSLHRLGSRSFWWTSALNEKTAKEDGLIKWQTDTPSDLDQVVLQGPHFTVGSPFYKQPNPGCKSNKDYTVWNLEQLPELVIPRTNYARACSPRDFANAIKDWGGRAANEYFRIAWRDMTSLKNERSHHAAIIPPGPTHIHTVHTIALQDNRQTSCLGGIWTSLPFDYLVKVSGVSNVSVELVRNFPAPLEHPLARPLLLRVLRLNCLTRDYAPLWEELFDPAWFLDRWTNPSSIRPAIQDVEPTWSMATPLRTEHDRRMALVEIDALVAVMLGLTAEQLCAMYRSQFAVLRKYEWEMFFAPDGHKIGAATHNVGIRQTKEETEYVKAWVKAARNGDATPVFPEGWVKPNREAEMTRAHADFTARLLTGEYGDYAAYAAEYGDHGNLLAIDSLPTYAVPESR